MRLIDANAILLELKSRHDLFINEWEGFSALPEKDKARVDEITNCMADIFNAPTVDAVEVVHGRWIWHNERRWFEFKYECSICHDGSDLESDYCPNCGAKMDGERKDDATD